MLKIAPNPDAAFEICTIFAPDCKHQYQLKRRLSYYASSSGNNDYERKNEEDSDRDATDNILRSTINIPVSTNIKQIKLRFEN